MTSSKQKARILIFIGNLQSGGKERRLIELLGYLQERCNFEIKIILTVNEIHYPAFYDLNVSYEVIKKSYNDSVLTVFVKFYEICKKFKPHIIHTWGRIQSLYSLPTVILQNIPIINSQITSAPPSSAKNIVNHLIDRLNFKFSTVILSNSKAGILSYNPPANKSKVIYNGINLNRFNDLPSIKSMKEKYGILTPYTIVMSASFSPNKDYDLFYRVAKKVTEIREDVTFIGVGVSHDDFKFNKLLSIAKNNKRILFPGGINDVEALVNACDIGVLFSNKEVHGEGISNSIMEYMALSKPVVANDAGGTREIVRHNANGFLITDESDTEISTLIIELLNDNEKCKHFGKKSRDIIEEAFSINKMGEAFVQLYNSVVVKDKLNSYNLKTLA